MCGIVGGVGRQIPSGVLESLRHRGPDGAGKVLLQVAGRDVALGHTRLAILDLSPAGHQPMQSRDGRWWITFNGEIYNHLELRRDLDCDFRGHSDTETLVELFAKYGVETVLPRLNGMFAFAAVDLESARLYLARDPFGVKPVYYSASDHGFYFSSEIRALLKLSGIRRSLDQGSLSTFLALRYVPSPSTLLEGVKRLSPGHFLCLSLGGQLSERISCYMRPASERFSGSINDAVSIYRSKLSAAVNRQLLSDVPVGLLLSGGIDSALVGAMARDAGHLLPAFTVGFEGNYRECEIDAARETAEVLGLRHYAVDVSATVLRDSLSNIVESVEEPLATTSVMPMWFLAKKAREHCPVVLTGQGTDEPWGGYRRYQVEMVRRLLPVPALWRMANRLLGQFPLPDAVERGLRTLGEGAIDLRILEAGALFGSRERQMLTGHSECAGAIHSIRYWLDWLRDSDCETVERMMRLDTRMNLADDLLLYGDKISMASSLEARVPMLDLDLVRFVESLPVGYRLDFRRTKIVHKAMAAEYLPASIVNRPKLGFQVPFGLWARGEWREYIEEVLLGRNASWLEVVDRVAVKSIWDQHLKGRPDRSRQVFACLTLALWYRHYVSGEG